MALVESVRVGNGTPTGRKSRRSASVVLPTLMRDDGSIATRQNGTVWKYVPLSPAGASPSRANSAATYAAVLKSPSLPDSRPIIESSAMRRSRRSRSAAVIAAVVALAGGDGRLWG